MRGIKVPQVHQMDTIKCLVNLNRASLQMIPVENSHKLYKLQFLFDAAEACTVKVHYAVTEQPQENAEPKFVPESGHQTTRFEKGFGILYNQPASEYLDISKYGEEELFYNPDTSFYPVVIVLQPERKSKEEIASQTTYATLIHSSDGSWLIRPIKQKIWFNGKSFVASELYGVENGETDGRECVICMTDPRDTTVLPCRHMCLCSTCADKLRQQTNKCPICRTTINSMINIKLSHQKELDSSSGSDEDDEHALLNKKKFQDPKQGKLEQV